jgi:hypothetical protein
MVVFIVMTYLDILGKVLGYLTPNELGISGSIVCHQWNRISRSSILWQSHFSRRWGNEAYHATLNMASHAYIINWYDQYRLRVTNGRHQLLTPLHATPLSSSPFKPKLQKGMHINTFIWATISIARN